LNDSDVNDVSLMLKERISLDPVSSALFQLLQDLVTQRIYEQAASEILDPEILAMLVEESVTTRISNLSFFYESSGVRLHLYLCGFERDEAAPEGHTPWVRNKTSLFSYRSMLP